MFGITYLFMATPVYTSTARMSVTPANRTADMQSFNDGTNSYLYTQSELIMSPSVLALALRDPAVARIVADEPDAVQYLQRFMSVDVGKRDTVLTVSFSSTDRDEAATMANAIVAAYQKYQIMPRQSDSAELSRLDEENAALEKHITDTTSRMQELERENGALDPANPHNTLADHTLSDLTHELMLAQLDELKAKQASVSATNYIEKLKKKGMDTDAVDGEMLDMSPEAEARLPSDIVILRQALQQTHYLPSHPTYRAMEQRLQHLELTQARVLQNRAEVAGQRMRDLAAAVSTAREEASKANAASFKYARLQTDLNNDQKRKEAIATRTAQVNETRALGMLDIEMLEPARSELRPSHPSRKTTLPLSLALGMLIGGGLGFLRDRRDDRFRTVDEIRNAMGVPLLGTIPQLPHALAAPQAGRQSQIAPGSAIAEACRTIRTAIQFGAPKDRCRTMLVTSPSSADGKSTLASNLAITMAQAGKHVLVVDADLRLPTQHTIFNVCSDNGLSTVLQGTSTLDQAIQPTGIEGLDLLPCGPLPASPTEMLNSSTFADLLETLADRYDQVVIDSPPVMGIADARIIAAAADMTVLVLRADKSTRRASELARDGLGSVGAQLLGVIVNDMNAMPGDAYSYHAYRRQPVEAPLVQAAGTRFR